MVIDKNQKMINHQSGRSSIKFHLISFILYCSIDEHLKNPLAYRHPQLVYLMC